MRDISDRFKNEQNNDNRNYLKYADITLTDGTVINLTNADFWSNGMKFEDSVSDDNTFNIGSANINTLNLSINNFDGKYTDYDFTDATVICYVGIELEPEDTSALLDTTGDKILDTTGSEIIVHKNALIEKIRICTMTVIDTPYQNTTIIELECEDNMRKFDRDYSASKLKYPATRKQIIQDACKVCGVTLDTLNFYQDSYQIPARPDDEALTFRQVIAWTCQIGCQYARCDKYGRLTIKWYDTEITDANRVAINSTNGFTPNLDDVVITGVQVTEYLESTSTDEEASSYLYGEEGYVLKISENKLIPQGTGEVVANIIGEKCVGMSFRPFETECLTDIVLEAGDAVLITDRKGNKYKSFLTNVVLQPGSFEQISCNAESAARNSSKTYSLVTQAAVDARKSVWRERTTREQALQEFKDRLDNSTGVYTTVQTQQDGSQIFYLHDKPTLAESQAVWKMTAEAWGVSTDGGQTWNGGMTVDGDTIVRILNAVGVNADWINAGSITVTDTDGSIIFSVDMDTGTVTLDGSCVTIGGKSLDEKIEDVENMAALARNMTIQLDNDYQGIPVDSDGNYTEFPECTTTATVMYGTQDITDNCTYTITTSQNVHGSWDKENKTYTVTGLTADSGWVNIKAAYLNNLVVSKQFSLAKQYAGPQGEPGTAGRTYFFQSNADVLLMGADKKITPAPLIVDSFYRDGNGEVAQSQKGWWKLEKSTDNGATWSALTVSQTAALDRLNINVNGLSLKAHDMLKASLYFDQSKTKLADYQTYSVAVDVASLTQEQIVDILSDGGKFKGLYYGKDESGNTTLYISFNAMKGGVISLGGTNNGNGQLKIYDADGNQISRLGYTGYVVLNKNTGNPMVSLNTAGLRLYTDYTDSDNYKALMLGKYGLYAMSKNGGTEEIWMEGDTSKQWEGYIIRYLSGKVRINANSLFTDGCSLEKNFSTDGNATIGGNATIDGTLKFYDLQNQVKTSGKVKRQPVASVSAVGSQVAYLSSGTGTPAGSTATYRRLGVCAQWGGTSSAAASFNTDYLYTGTQASDIRLKDNIKNSTTTALETVNKMKARQFDWKKERGGWHQNIGFVADELEEIDPNLALGGGYDENGEMDVKQINSPYLLNYAIKAIQELSAKVDEQEKRIKELEMRLQ